MANKDKLIESAQKFLAKGQLPKAIGEYQKIVDAFPKDFRNRQKLAELLSRDKRNEDARPHYEAVAKNFVDTGFYLKAIAIYKQMQKLDPTNGAIYQHLAELNEKQGLVGNALNEYRSLIALHDKNRQPRESLVVLRKMLALDVDSIAVRIKLIETLLAVDEQAEALEHYRLLDSSLRDRGDTLGLERLQEKFAALSAQELESRSRTAVPEAVAEAASLPSPAPVRGDPEAFAKAHPHPELELDLDLPADTAGRPEDAEPGAPAAAVADLPLEIELEFNLDLPDELDAEAVPTDSPVLVEVQGDDHAGEPLPPDDLELPEFCDLELDAESYGEEAAGGADIGLALADPGFIAAAAVSSDGAAVPMEDVELYEAPEEPDGVEIADAGLPAGEPEAFEELEEIESLDEVHDESPFSGADPSDIDLHAAVFFPDQAGGEESLDEGMRPGSREVDEDAQSHFDLGIAYKEMGLLDEAIAEFGKAAHEPSRHLDCLTLQGQCLVELGRFEAAETTFREALGSPGLTVDVRVALRYELGLLYESAGRLLEALESFQFVADQDLFFRDVVAKQKALRQKLGLDEQPADPADAKLKRDRISYV